MIKTGVIAILIMYVFLKIYVIVVVIAVALLKDSHSTTSIVSAICYFAGYLTVDRFSMICIYTIT